MAETIEIASPDGATFGGYLVVPARTPIPGLVLLQEIFGVNESMRRAAVTFCGAGYVTLAPDLFWRIEPSIDLGYDEADWTQARAHLAAFDVDKGIGDIGAAVETLKGHPACNGTVAVLGFCLGGKLAYLSAARLEVAAAVAFYGVRIHEMLDEADRITCPVQFHFGEQDKAVPMETVAPIRDAFAGRRDVEFHVYPEAGHGFFSRLLTSWMEARSG